MMKILKAFVLFMLLFSLTGINASASAEEEAWEDFSTLVGEDDSFTADELCDRVGVEALLSEIMTALSAGKGRLASFFSLILLSCVLISICESSAFLENLKYHGHILAAVITLSSVAIFSALYPVLSDVREGLESIGSFFGALIPIMTGISFAAGSTATASTVALNMNITLSCVMGVALKLLLPLAVVSFSLTLADGFSLGATGSLVRCIKGIFSWVLGILTAIIIGGVSMQSIISSATDSAAIRAARTCAADIIPVVGSTVSTSLSTLIGGLSYVKDAVGIGSVVFIVGIATAPLVILLLYRLILSFGISFMDFIGATGGSRTFSAFRGALDSLIAVFTVSTIVYIIEIIVFMKCGVVSLG